MKYYKQNLKSGKIHREQPTEQCNTDDASKLVKLTQDEVNKIIDPDFCGYCFSPKYARLRGEKP